MSYYYLNNSVQYSGRGAFRLGVGYLRSKLEAHRQVASHEEPGNMEQCMLQYNWFCSQSTDIRYSDMKDKSH